MTEQQAFDNVVRILDCKGQCVHLGGCVYFKLGHPGCAIGCQPGFARFEDLDDINLGYFISELMEEHPTIAAFFDGCRSNFLNALQSLHDRPDHWDESGSLTDAAKRWFAEKWKLAVPSA